MDIIRDIKEEIRAVRREPTSRDLTILALLFFVIPSAIGGFMLWKGAANGWIWIIAGACLGVSRVIGPFFKALYKLWVTLSIILGYFVSRILLTIIFFIVITPMGLIMRILGKDPMDRKLDPNAATYWSPKEREEDTSVNRYEKQF
ncbi:MAG TPA: SxtJ family membrane protein [Desulfomonilaceae bacterium]|nr:SxtJ family membrane protein [Desulfomonilaceae bacterium]